MNEEQEREFEQWVEIHRGKDLTADKLSKYITKLLNNEREEIAKGYEAKVDWRSDGHIQNTWNAAATIARSRITKSIT